MIDEPSLTPQLPVVMPPISTPDSCALWKSEDPATWRAELAAYDDRIAALNDPKLRDLDAWYHRDLARAVRTRSPPHLLKDEYVKLVEWKITRGKWRPLLSRAKEHAEGTIRAATEAAIKALDAGKANLDEQALGAALAPLLELKFCGPATAAAVLSCIGGDEMPIMSDELIAVALPDAPSSKTYSTARLVELVESARRKGNAIGLRAAEVERAIFAAAAKTKPPKKRNNTEPSGAGASEKKRKR